MPSPTVSLDLLWSYVERRLIRAQRHPRYPLTIWNYTQRTQFDQAWDEVTTMARGLVTDDDGRVIARPFPKFFNLGEVATIPDEPFEVTEKLDGSLIIVFLYEDDAVVASRGSFISEHARWAQDLLDRTYPHVRARLRPGVTYLFELIHPENRIVVDYGPEESLTLIVMLDTATGRDLPLEDLGTPMVRAYPELRDWSDLPDRPNAEGYVLRFESGLRLKVKQDEYLRVHRLICGVNARTIWEMLRSGQDLDAALEVLPDEFMAWVHTTADRIMRQYQDIEARARSVYDSLDRSQPRRELAAVILQDREIAPVVFQMLDEKSYADTIWKLVRPSGEERPEAVQRLLES